MGCSCNPGLYGSETFVIDPKNMLCFMVFINIFFNGLSSLIEMIDAKNACFW